MKDTSFEVDCPCCGARLEIDPETRSILSHTPARPKHAPEDLQAAMARLKAEEKGRDKRFANQFEAQKTRGRALEKRFESLLKKTDDEPLEKPLRDFDLD